MAKCPKCKGEAGFYQKMVSSYTQLRDWQGIGWAAEDKNVRGGKRKYCSDCHADVTKYVNEKVLKGDI